MKKLPSLYQEFIHLSRYSRWMQKEKRRETWEETVKRYFDFFEKHLKERVGYELKRSDRVELENSILSLKVMPSMRCLMAAGDALSKDEVAGYNCSFVAIDNPRSFDEILYILSCGTGVGFSVERQYVSQLPCVAESFYETDSTIVVQDSRIGWAKSLKELIGLLYQGQIPKIDISKVRAAGVPLKTFGGRASGPEPLVDLFAFCIRVFRSAAGRKLQSIECHDIVCKIAEVIVVGGVRRCQFFKYNVLLYNGKYKQISELQIGDKVKFNDKPVSVVAVINNGVQQTMNIKMENNTTHICTPEHRWFVYNHDINECEWIETQDLSSGNYSMLEPKNE
jgi:ribonucleoside-diphosphate reductase alpha chain